MSCPNLPLADRLRLVAFELGLHHADPLLIAAALNAADRLADAKPPETLLASGGRVLDSGDGLDLVKGAVDHPDAAPPIQRTKSVPLRLPARHGPPLPLRADGEIEGYRSRVSGPLLDRIDIHLEVPAVAYRDLVRRAERGAQRTIRSRVDRARMVQRERFRGRPALRARRTPSSPGHRPTTGDYSAVVGLSRDLLLISRPRKGATPRSHFCNWARMLPPFPRGSR
jgi:hypothetical protein